MLMEHNVEPHSLTSSVSFFLLAPCIHPRAACLHLEVNGKNKNMENVEYFSSPDSSEKQALMYRCMTEGLTLTGNTVC